MQLNKEYKLRDYQLNQLDFIRDRLPVADVISLESPTGSGKSIVILEFVKEWLKENPLSNAVISTGMNNLVFQFERNAYDFGLNPKVLIGKKAVNCPVEQENHGLEQKIFTETPCLCGKKHLHLDVEEEDPSLKMCPFTRDAYKKHLSEIMTHVGQVIITNHSTLLAHQNMDTFANVGLLVVDEAHTFTNFYDSYLKLELDMSDLMQVDQAIGKLKEPMKSIIKMNMQRGKPLPKQQLDALCSKISNPTVRANAREFFETEPALNNFIEHDPQSYAVHKFYKSFEININAKKLLVSATMDAFTRSMFNVRQSNEYRELKTFVDYSNSKFVWVDHEDYGESFKLFMHYISKKYADQDKISGLALSTTMKDARTALSMDGLEGFRMYDDLTEFKESNEPKKVLCGSRLFFQGLDIPELDFVCLNKIPFPLYDDKMRAQQEFLTDRGKNDFDAWGNFTIPKVENDILQSSGRLWRSPDSKGVFGIFDHRVEKFKYIFKHTMNVYRHGIESLKIEGDGTIDEFWEI